MPKHATPLTVRRVEAEKRPGMYADGNGLYFRVAESGTKSWVFRYQIEGRRRDMGLGPVGMISLADARNRAFDLRRGIRDGIDPLEAKREAKSARQNAQAATAAISFAAAAAAYIAVHEAGWRDKRAWPDSMRLYVNPIIGDRPVSSIDLSAVLAVLEPIWLTKIKTAQNIRGRIENVLDWAAVRGYRSGENPARWRGNLDKLLARPSLIATVTHHPALPWREMPEFMRALRSHDGISSTALEFTILTCARAGEALGARWPEIDLSGRVWTVPASRMKSRREHRVPLAASTLAVLDRMAPFRRNSDDHVFLGWLLGRPMSPQSLLQCLERVRPGVTVHGFRSSFRDWAAETGVAGELAELALAHQVGSAVERAYLRSDRFDERRRVAEAWAAHCG